MSECFTDICLLTPTPQVLCAARRLHQIVERSQQEIRRILDYGFHSDTAARFKRRLPKTFVRKRAVVALRIAAPESVRRDVLLEDFRHHLLHARHLKRFGEMRISCGAEKG